MTSIEWLIDQLIPEDQHEGIMDIIEDAKDRHKQEIIDAYSSGRFDYEDYSKGIKEKVKQSEEYYKQLYKQK